MYASKMDTTSAFTIVILFILTTVLIVKDMEHRTRFEEDETRRELLELFIKGFTDGLGENSDSLDRTLKRIGYTYPEQIDKIAVDQSAPPDIQEEATYVPMHEIDFDLETAAKKDNAEWAQIVQLPEEN